MKTADLKLSIITALLVPSYMTFIIVAVNGGFVSNFALMSDELALAQAVLMRLLF
ncbi:MULTISPECIES: hypothetical protein [unclassified Flavobacterium]|uniref:hypothetical protein n=1 Tax=unclassified Flavobacterium TaxID=196869 RepID=UPI00131599F2|nr:MULTISPECIES: hypothetical protein [unclassified Flavobacterium]